ncbi:hypothetical protein ID0154_11720 [Helicobacter pylori]
MDSCKKSAKLLIIKEIVVWGVRSQILAQEVMRDALNGENLESIEDFSAWANEVKREVDAKN